MDSSAKAHFGRTGAKAPVGSKSYSSGSPFKPQADSPYYSSANRTPVDRIDRTSFVSTRRTQSATQSRERDLSTKKQTERASQRKYSEPSLSMSPSVETKVLHKASVTKPKSASSLSARQRKDFPAENGSGDVHGGGSSAHKKKLKKLQTARGCLGDDISSAFQMLAHEHELSFSQPSEHLSMEPNCLNDRVLLSQSDNLYRDVVALCGEMGLDSSAITDASRQGSWRSFQNQASPRQLSYDCAEELCSVSPPLWTALSAVSTPRPRTRPSSQSHSPLLPAMTNSFHQLQQTREFSEEQDPRPVSADSLASDESARCLPPFKGSNQVSANSSRRSSGAGDGDAYAKILSSLRHIEDEERKGSETAAKFGDFLRQKYGSPTNCDSPAPRPRSSSIDRNHQHCDERAACSPRVLSPSQGSFGYCRGRESSCSARLGTPKTDRSHYSNENNRRSPRELSEWSAGALYVCAAGKKETSSVPKLPPLEGPLEDVQSRPGRSSDSRPASRLSKFEDAEFGYAAGGVAGSSYSTPRDDAVSARQRNGFGPGGRETCWQASDEKSRSLFSFLDEVEKSDRDILFSLKYDGNSPTNIRTSGRPANANQSYTKGNLMDNHSAKTAPDFSAQTMDSLIRRGSVDLAREVIMLQRNLEDSAHSIHVLEETLLSQRELNIRNIKCAERDLKKRLKLQQEEFELALSRHQAFVDQLIGEKRALQDKCEKVLKESKESEQKYQNQVKSLQEKHMEELKRLRRIQESAEKNRKNKWVGVKTQEIREMTVKGLEPEVQKIITRHQQEMTEMRAWHADELREMEERYARKQTLQLQELREAFGREREEACRRERDLTQKRFDSELQRLAQDFETQKRRLFNEIQDEKNRSALEESKFRELMQENVRKAQIKGEVEVENVREECELKLANLERRHENEVRSLKDVYEAERESWLSSLNKKQEQLLHEREVALLESLSLDKDKELRDREKRLKDDFDKLRKEDEADHEARIRRMSEKFQSELAELEVSEKELKQKFTQAKSEVLAKEEELFSLKTTLALKEKQNAELADANMKMLEERAHLTSVIRREFAAQIDVLEEECRAVKAAVSELRAKHKLELETRQTELEKVRGEKETEIEKIGLRVKQALVRKEDTIQELSKQLEKAQIRIRHLDDLLEQQRKDFVSSMTTPTTLSKKK